jgi:serine/threonine-protein kinase
VDIVKCAAWITLGVLIFSNAALADGKDADRLFEEGRAFAKAKNYPEACDRFAKSLAIERTIGTELNLADCQEQLNHLREAWGLFIAAAGESEAGGNSKRADFARERAAALEPRMTAITLKVAQPALPGLVITISGRATPPAAEIHEHTDPGPIDVIATAPNLPHFKRTETGAAGATIVVEIPPLDTSVHASVPGPTPVASVTEGPRDRGRVRIAYGVGIGGAAALVAAGTLTVIARLHYDSAADGSHCERVTAGVECDMIGSQQIRDAQGLANIGTGLAIGGAALAGAALAVYFTAPREQVRVAPAVTGQSVGMVLAGTF